MIPPFGTPILFTVSLSKETGTVLKQFLDLFVGPSLPYHYSSQNNLVVTSAEDLIYQLDSLDHRNILNAVCLVDLSDGESPKWNIHKDEGGLRATELVLRYPEVYWIFLTDNVPDELKAVEKDHFVSFANPCHAITLLYQHVNGFRTWFDATGFRKSLRVPLPVQDSGQKEAKRHSAPFRSQTIANSLIRRSQVIASEAKTSRDGIHAALLAHEAWDILDGKTFTLSLEALNLLHRMEAVAECAFIGASADLPVDERCSEIEAAIEALKIDLANKLRRYQHAEHATTYAASIDEEESFVMLNGYVLYRYGYSTFVVPSLSEMKRIFGYRSTHGNIDPEVADIKVVMEDLDLRFDDSDDEKSAVPDYEERISMFPGLAASDRNNRRIVVSSGIKTNSIFKPYGGVFDKGIRDRLGNRTSLLVKCEKNNCNELPAQWEFKKYSALVQIVDDIRQVYREYEQFEEEEKALSKVREYRWDLKYCDIKKGDFWKEFREWIKTTANNSLLRKPIRFSRSIIELYFYWLLDSIINISIASAAWILIFACLFYAISNEDLLKTIGFSALNFFQMQKSLDYNMAASKLHVCFPKFVGKYIFFSILLAEMVIAYAHLGIFIAYLYQKISRK